MIKYPKIHTIFKRDEKTHKLILNEYSKPEFEFLANNIWQMSEKIDGTNLRVAWDHETKRVTFGGRTDNAQIQNLLLNRLQEIFNIEILSILYPDVSILFFGEGYGYKIQTGEKYKANGNDFILFDVLVGKWWLKRESVDSTAKNLNIHSVPIIKEGNLAQTIELARNGFNSIFGNFIAEGIVIRPKVELLNRGRERIIAKLKYSDFK